MYITDTDYKIMIGEQAFIAISRADEQTRRMAEHSALEEVAGYLRPTYDTGTEYALEGDKRNKHLVMLVCDIALYHLAASMPSKMGGEIRKERYERAVKWLEDVQKGRIVPALPIPAEGEEPAGNGGTEYGVNAGKFHYGGATKQNNYW